MVIAHATMQDGADLLVIGLSQENRDRLAQGYPIDITATTHGDALPKNLRLVIFGGTDEAAMQQSLAPLITPATQIVQTTRQGGA